MSSSMPYVCEKGQYCFNLHAYITLQSEIWKNISNFTIRHYLLLDCDMVMYETLTLSLNFITSRKQM